MLIDTVNCIDATQAAEMLNISRFEISRLFKKRQFSTQAKIGHFWIVDRREVEAFLAWRESGFHYDPAADDSNDDFLRKESQEEREKRREKLRSVIRTLSPIRE